MQRLILSALSCVLFLPLLMAQQANSIREDEAARVESPARTDKESYRAIPCGRDGALIFFKSVEVADAQRIKWYFSFYDEDLHQKWVKSLPLSEDLDFRFKFFSGDTVFLVFTYNGKMKSVDQPLEILRIALKKGSFIPNITKVPANSEPDFFYVLGRYAFLALNHKTGQAAVEILDLKSNHSKGFLIDRENPAAFRWFQIDTVGPAIKAIVTKTLNKKEVEHWYKVFDTIGNEKISVRISAINQDREFTGFQAISDQKGDQLVIGTYRLNSGRASTKNKTPDQSSGIFTSLIVPGNQKNLNFINFLELKSISTLLSSKDLIDLKKKALKKNKNIGEYSLDFSVIQHEPIEHEGQYIGVSEVFYPQFHAENYTDFDFYGRPFTNSYSVFDGYKFTGAIFTAFNSAGQKLWDNIMEFKDMISSDLNPKVVTRFHGDTMLLAYYTGGKIASKVIHNEETTGKIEFSLLESKYPDDKLITETRSGLMPWYDSFFLCYGFQEIKNVALESNNKRFVFQLTKVKFEE